LRILNTPGDLKKGINHSLEEKPASLNITFPSRAKGEKKRDS